MVLSNLITEMGNMLLEWVTLPEQVFSPTGYIYHDTLIRHKDKEDLVQILFLGHGHGLG